MAELTHEDILKGIDFPHNAWRTAKNEKPETSPRRNRALVFIKRLRDAGIPPNEVKGMLSDLYWDAFVEHELQVKESTGKSVKEIFLAKAQEDLKQQIEVGKELMKPAVPPSS